MENFSLILFLYCMILFLQYETPLPPSDFANLHQDISGATGLAGPSLGGEDVDPVEGVNKIALEIRFALGNSNFSPAELVGAADG